MKITIILGTRPEIIKMAPVIRALERYNLERRTLNVEHFILHTGQHYSYNMDRVFFEQLKLPPAKYNLEIGSGSHAGQTGKILIGVSDYLFAPSKKAKAILLGEGILDEKILVTGGLGFIGSNLVPEIRKRGVTTQPAIDSHRGHRETGRV